MIACRAATEADYRAYVRLFRELGIPDPVSSAARFREHVLPQTIVAEGEKVVGYATWRAYGELAHVVNVAVAPEVRGRRVGQALLEHVRSLAEAAGCTRWYLNVKEDNVAARRLYARCGFALDHRSWAVSIPWAAARALPVDSALERGAARPEEDAAIAARFGVPAERLVGFRARGTMQLLVVREAGPVAFAAFDPGFPGAALFAAARPELAGTLLAALDEVALHHRFDFVRLTVERDQALSDALLAAGATLTFALLQLGAPISRQALDSKDGPR